MSSNPLLSIVLPTYNRAGHLKKLVDFLTANIVSDDRYAIEIIIVDNASTDKTALILKEVSHPCIRIVTRAQHLPTAEENIFNSLQEASGEYVWFLGDDDVPVLANFNKHYQRLADASHDLLVFNPAIVDSNGTLALIQNVKMNRESFELPIGKLAITIGCFFTLAGISNSIIRRNILSTERGLHYFGVSQIYSMVAWLIEAAKDRKCIFINQPLVYYRENDYSNGHWTRVADRMNVGDYYFWTDGILALLNELFATKSLSASEISQIMEVDRDGNRYNLVNDMLFKYYQQVLLYHNNTEARQIINDRSWERMSNFFAITDPTTYDLVECLKAAVKTDDGKPDEKLMGKFLYLFQERQSICYWIHRVGFVYNGYEIIETPIQFTAIHISYSAQLNKIMRYVDPLPKPPLVLTSSNWPDLRAQIDKTDTTDIDAYHAPEVCDELTNLKIEVIKSHQRISSLLASSSWKLTAPFRKIKSWFCGQSSVD